MDEASQQQSPGRATAPATAAAFIHAIDDAVPTLSIRFAVHPNATVTWKIASDSTLRVCCERIWLTRARSPYDHWLGPGDTIRLARGERIWVSSDAQSPAHVTLTSAWSRRRTLALAWIEWLAGWHAVFAPRRARRS
jgi:hypothetical protein